MPQVAGHKEPKMRNRIIHRLRPEGQTKNTN